MSRELKFRIWNKDVKEMFKSFDLYNELAENSDIDSIDMIEIMQFTGLKDRNGKEIYEGDIFDCIYKRDGCNHKLMIVWGRSDASFRIRYCGECDQPNVRQSVTDIQRGKVIGNIYENPELLDALQDGGEE